MIVVPALSATYSTGPFGKNAQRFDQKSSRVSAIAYKIKSLGWKHWLYRNITDKLIKQVAGLRGGLYEVQI